MYFPSFQALGSEISLLEDIGDKASVYDYGVLQPTAQEIRVLCIDLDRNVSGRISMKCRLKQISLRCLPIENFHAVSYCWGSSKKRAPLVIDGHNVAIPRTAAIAIRNLSKVSSYPLWIDAVCIDQNNLQEKGQQVTMMKEVYSKAVSVLIWLGHAQRSTADAIASIEKIYQQCLGVIGSIEYLDTHLYRGAGFKYSDAPLPDCDWSALRVFYSAPWFRRLWVIQEIGLAKDSTFYVGSFSIGAEKVVLVARWMVHRKYTRYYKGQESPGVENASSMYRPAGRLFSNQLRRTHRAGCSVAQDKIYGVLGLLRQDTASAVVVDYTKPLVEVYARAIRLALYEVGDLSFLQFAKWYVDVKPRTTRARHLIQLMSCGFLIPQSSQDDHWVSWVLKLHGETSDESGACRNVLFFDRSTMSASFKLPTRILEESLTLSLKGQTIDRITNLGPMFTVDLLRTPSKLVEAVRWCVRHGRNEFPPEDGNYMKDLAICLTCGSNEFNEDVELDQMHTQAFEMFLQEYQQPSTIIGCKMSGRLNRILSWVPGQDPPLYWHHLWTKALNRRFFVTATGMMGIGPLASKAEDLICVLYGSEVPFILRPLGHEYELIGDTYVRCRGMRCSGTTCSDATEQGAVAENTLGNDLVAAFAQTSKAEMWYDII